MLFNLNYICNFKPQLITLNNNALNMYVRLRKNNHILCRNLFLFLLYLKYCYKNKIFSNLSIFIKPKKNHRETILRAPYRYKLGRYQLGLSRYLILCSFSFKKFDIISVSNLNHILIFNSICKKFYPWLESNICFQHKVTYSFYIIYSNNFLISNYKNLIS